MNLHLYEELALLSLSDRLGTFTGGHWPLGLAGAIVAELLLERRIRLEGTKAVFLELADATPLQDPILDSALEKFASARRRAQATVWITRISGDTTLKHRVGRRLCERGIVRADERQILLIFKQKVYPEVNPAPELELRDRIRQAVVGEGALPDARTQVIIALADSAGLLSGMFDRKQFKSLRPRLQQLRRDAAAGAATQQAVDEMDAAIVASITVAASMQMMVMSHSD